MGRPDTCAPAIALLALGLVATGVPVKASARLLMLSESKAR